MILHFWERLCSPGGRRPARQWIPAITRRAIPVLLWFAFYALLLRIFVPRMREASRAMSEMRSQLSGRVVDAYTNILTVKQFARPRDEDAFVRDAVGIVARARGMLS